MVEFFPFSTFPMFSDSPSTIAVVLSPPNNLLFVPYLANEHPRLSRTLPFQSIEILKKNFKKQIDENSADKQLALKTVTIGAIDNQHVGIIAVEQQ